MTVQGACFTHSAASAYLCAAVWTCGVVQTIIYCDFFYYYFLVRAAAV